MQPTFNPPSSYLGSELLCPHCNGNYLHVHSITSTEPERGDRDDYGVMIEHECEFCAKKSTLSIQQHEGGTWVDFKPNGAK